MKTEFITLIFLMNWIFQSCEVINPAEEIPAYIHIDSIQFQIMNVSQGSASSKITDAWVYVNGTYLGTYELPATFPVLASGESKISVSAGIWENGISSTRKYYPFYYPHIEYRSLSAKETDTIFPIVKYNDNVTFDFIEDFESVGTKFSWLSGDTSIVRVVDSNVYEGNGCGAVFLFDTITLCEFVSSDKFTISAGTNVFAEMNYKCNNTFYVGIYLPNSSEKAYQTGINSKSEWNKIYINLTDLVGQARGNEFQLLFKVEQNTGITSPAVYWDNIKMIH